GGETASAMTATSRTSWCVWCTRRQPRWRDLWLKCAHALLAPQHRDEPKVLAVLGEKKLRRPSTRRHWLTCNIVGMVPRLRAGDLDIVRLRAKRRAGAVDESRPRHSRRS